MKSLFYFVMECLGIRYFKKYWVVGGSAWNERHADKNNVSDLERIIMNLKDYSRQHIQQVVMLCFICVPVLIYSPAEHVPVGIATFVVAMVVQMYALSVQLYNYCKAKDRLNVLPKHVVHTDETQDQYELFIIKPTDKDKFKSWYKIELPEQLYQVDFGARASSPYMRTTDECVLFREYLYQKYGRDVLVLLNNITSESLKLDYQEFTK